MYIRWVFKTPFGSPVLRDSPEDKQSASELKPEPSARSAGEHDASIIFREDLRRVVQDMSMITVKLPDGLGPAAHTTPRSLAFLLLPNQKGLDTGLDGDGFSVTFETVGTLSVHDDQLGSRLDNAVHRSF
jgi:hypothetical protein